MRVFLTYADLQAALELDPCKSHRAFRFLPEYSPAGFRCATCGEVKPFPFNGCGTGYGVERDESGAESFHCYACCSEKERARLIERGEGHLYLTGLPLFGMKPKPGEGLRLSDWPGGLSFPVKSHWTGRHDIARVVHFVRFIGPDGREWAGRMTGENTQVCRVRRLKGRGK